MPKIIQSICNNCDTRYFKPGKLVEIYRDGGRFYCNSCGKDVTTMGQDYLDTKRKRWDSYFHSICEAVATKSPCLSRQIGAILVRDHSVVATGFNGPARGIPHCGHDRFMKDETLKDIKDYKLFKEVYKHSDIKNTCPRKLLGYTSGTGMEWCTAQHAEANCIANAARLGVSTVDTILYMNCVIPCKSCFGILINAGIVEIVIDDITPYDVHTKFLIENSKIKIRKFDL